MMKVKVARAGEGLHPSEIVVTIRTVDGDESLIIDHRSIMQGDFINVGFPVGQREDQFLIELPRETSSGGWRVWVSKTEVEQIPERQYA